MKSGDSKTSTADYFVVNDNSKPGSFKIFSMSELLDFSSFSWGEGLAKYATINGYDNPEWENQGETARERITNLMMQMHQTKLHAFASSQMIFDKIKKI